MKEEKKIVMQEWKVKAFLNRIEKEFTKEEMQESLKSCTSKSAYIDPNGYITFAPSGMIDCVEIEVKDGWNRNIFKTKKELLQKIESIIVEPAEHKRGTAMDAYKQHLDIAIEGKDFEEAAGIIERMKTEEAEIKRQEERLIQERIKDALEVEDYETAATLKKEIDNK